MVTSSERKLRARSGPKPIYTMDDMDEDSFEDERTSEERDMVTSSERKLRVRSGPKPIYTMDDMDEDSFEDERTNEEVCPLGEIDKILNREFRPVASNDPDSEPSQIPVKQYLVKWKRLSYLHCSWVTEQEFEKAYKSHPRQKLKARVNKFNTTMDCTISFNGGDEYIAIHPEWTTVDRILACREEGDGKEYLVKFKELNYDETYWEAESDISAFQNEIQRFEDINSGTRRDKYIENERDQTEFKEFDHTPEFLKGTLHKYQLEGLNFLRYSWSKGTHVILADEMGLGKTIQAIAFLATLFEENQAPHLVVAPLSTLRNWEREFATWTPQLNVVMYTGTSEARRVIREHEFYLGNNNIKFDVLLTSYEMINGDTAFMKPIKWNCMIVDEGHRLKKMTSKLFYSLKQYTSKHRVLLTGTPLQNNLDELFVLMHFLDETKFWSLEEFQKEYKSINLEDQISKLHQVLAPHLLRRVKKDVFKEDELPSKKELILRVDLSSQQKHLYKAVLTRNYQFLTKKGGGKVSFVVLMELRKVCSHPYLLDGVVPTFENADEAFKQLLEASGKLQLLDKMMVKLKEQGHRVLIYSQFQRTLDLFQDYCSYKNWSYERIDGKVNGAERQVRIDRFNAENSNRFCFLLSTRAGGIGINLATADTVIIYDSDWNPHVDIQAMARAHRLGQTSKVIVYRLVHRHSVEEKIIDIAKKKMLLQHLVVGKLKQPHLTQDELDDIVKHGSKELFSEKHDDEAESSGKIHYDDAAIEKLLDRECIDAEEEGDEEENSFLKAFKVANFEYIDENEAAAAAVEEAQAIENKSSAKTADTKSHWEELLKGKHEVHQAEELSGLGKRKRKCKQVKYAEEDDDEFSGSEVSSDEREEAPIPLMEVSSDAREEAVEVAPQRTPRGKRPYRKRASDNSEPIPLMEGEETSLRVLGFNEIERKVFLDTFKRYGAGNFDWKEYGHPLKRKTDDEIKKYGVHFLRHISENSNNDSPTFSDGVPKEDIVSAELLISMTLMMLVKEKCQFMDDHPTGPVFPDHIVKMFSLRRGPLSDEQHDRIIIRAVHKHGLGRWVTIIDDKELEVEEIACKERGFPFPWTTSCGAEQVGLPESSLNQETGNAGNNNASAGRGKRSSYQTSILAQLVEKRFTNLEKAMKYEYAEKILARQAEAETKVMNTVGTSSVAADKEILQTEPISFSEDISAVAVDNKQDRVEEAQLYKESVNENIREKGSTSWSNYILLDSD
ncbi:PREDICTED: CHD3-type chromatin-remodeling factor CHR7 [Camelina sativa]|uniref:CHD3-type chromatin-remodeling factor CHR7 n=1 Tax=Camelina sativa TaxID=90675 RepID=A0ABM1QQI4_CAMSA|nr:PREDICTED: CHD3-type chromatin-remodeling factor CHR7 [Camelina sativa]